jgi:predicted DNA-binding protein
MTSSLKQHMTYLTYEQYAKLKRFASKHNIPMAQVVRESIDARIADGDRYSHGYNTALREAMRVVEDNKAARMRFPSGKSFAELVNSDIKKLLLENTHEEREVPAKSHATGGSKGSPEGEGQGDPDLGI